MTVSFKGALFDIHPSGALRVLFGGALMVLFGGALTALFGGALTVI